MANRIFHAAARSQFRICLDARSRISMQFAKIWRSPLLQHLNIFELPLHWQVRVLLTRSIAFAYTMAFPNLREFTNISGSLPPQNQNLLDNPYNVQKTLQIAFFSLGPASAFAEVAGSPLPQKWESLRLPLHCSDWILAHLPMTFFAQLHDCICEVWSIKAVEKILSFMAMVSLLFRKSHKFRNWIVRPHKNRDRPCLQ